MYRRTAALLIAAALSLGTAAAASGADSPKDSTPAQRLSAYVQPSIVYLETDWSARVVDNTDDIFIADGKVFHDSYTCTGFVITPDGSIATAGHCLTAKDPTYDINERTSILAQAVRAAVDDNEYGKGVSVSNMASYAAKHWRLVAPVADDYIGNPVLAVRASWGASVSGLQAAKRLPARVISASTATNGDIGLLKVEAKDLNALKLSTNADGPDTGTDIASVGYPAKVDSVTDADYTPSIKTGAISSKKTSDGGLTSVYEVDAAVAGGMSGGPTVNLDGEVIGVNSFGAGESEAFNFVRPTKLLLEATAAAGVKPAQSAESKLYRQGLDAYFDANRAVALKKLRDVVEEQPANGIAKDYFDKAKDLPKPAPKKESSDTGKVVLAAVAVAVLVGAIVIGVLFFSRRRKAAPAVQEAEPLPEETGPVPAGIVCGNCGVQATTPTTFCGNCGARL